MKLRNYWLLLPFFFLFSTLQAQEFEVLNDDEETEEEYPLNTFLRVSTSLFMVNSSPANIDFAFWDDDLISTDSISGFRTTDNLWTYGLNFGLGFLIEPDWMINIDTHLGWGSGGRFFNYVGQFGVGKEFKFGNFYIQPSISLGFVYSNLGLGDYESDTKGYFEVNNFFIFDQLSVDLRSRAASISPAFLIEYSIRRELSIFTKVSINYTFWDTHFVSVGGDTDEVNSDGETISTNERIDFTERNRLFFSINNQPIIDKKSPYFHYNFNSTLIQVGLSFAFNLRDNYDYNYDE